MMGSRIRFTVICLTGFLLLTSFSVDVAFGARSRNSRQLNEFVTKAKANVKSGNFVEARKDMIAALTLDPKNEENLYFAALIDYKVGKSATAIMRCDEILKNNRARKYRDKAIKLKRLAQDNMNSTPTSKGRTLRSNSITMIYSTAMENQKNFVDSGYSNVVKRVQMARHHSLDPVSRRNVQKDSAYDVLIGKSQPEPVLKTSPPKYAKAEAVSQGNPFAVDDFATNTDSDNSSADKILGSSEETDDVEFTSFDLNDSQTDGVEKNNPVIPDIEAPEAPADSGKVPVDSNGFGDFGEDVSTSEVKNTATADVPSDDSGFGDFGADVAEEKTDTKEDDTSGFGDFGDTQTEEAKPEPPKTESVKTSPAKSEESTDDSGFGDFGDDNSSSTPETSADDGFGDFGSDTEKTPAKEEPAKPEPEKKEDEDLSGFGDFGDESSEAKEKAEQKDDASDEGFGDFGDDSGSSEEDADDFGGFDSF